MRRAHLWLMLLLAGPARAAPPDPARIAFDGGRDAFEKGDYLSACQAFEEAYRLAPKPQVLFSLALAHRKQYLASYALEHLERSLELFRRYLSETPRGGRSEHARQHLRELEAAARVAQLGGPRAEAGAAGKGEAPTRIMVNSRTPGVLLALGDEDPAEPPLIRDVEPGRHKVRAEAPGFEGELVEVVAVRGQFVGSEITLKEKAASLTVLAPDGADVALDGRYVATAPLLAPLAVPAGKHLLVVSERGSYAVSRDLDLARGAVEAVQVQLETTTQRHVSYWFLGGGALALGGAAVAGGIALSAEGTAEALNDRRVERQGLTAAQLDTYTSALERRDRLEPVWQSLLVAGAASAATGALLYLLDTPRAER